MNDEQLFQLCKKYGAAALAGMSYEQVNVALRLEKKFEDKPTLKKALVEGEVSINKLARVASIATQENDVELAEKVKLLSKSALDVFVKDEKSLPGHSNPQESLPDVNLLEYLSLELQKELIERLNKGININDLLLELLKKHDREVAKEKEQLSKEVNPTKSRYIKVQIRKNIQKEHGNKCSVPYCNEPAEVLHHTGRFALTKAHDPRYLAPLCKQHHEIAHSVDRRFQEIRAG